MVRSPRKDNLYNTCTISQDIQDLLSLTSAKNIKRNPTTHALSIVCHNPTINTLSVLCHTPTIHALSILYHTIYSLSQSHKTYTIYSLSQSHTIHTLSILYHNLTIHTLSILYDLGNKRLATACRRTIHEIPPHLQRSRGLQTFDLPVVQVHHSCLTISPTHTRRHVP